MYKRQPKLRLGLASLIAAISIIAVLVIFIAPQIDLDDIVIRTGQLFFGLLLALISCHACQSKREGKPAGVSPGMFLARFGCPFPSLKVTNLLC